MYSSVFRIFLRALSFTAAHALPHAHLLTHEHFSTLALTTTAHSYLHSLSRTHLSNLQHTHTHTHTHTFLHQIVAFKPDIVITEKGVSDLAQHYFVKAGITAFRRYGIPPFSSHKLSPFKTFIFIFLSTLTLPYAPLLLLFILILVPSPPHLFSFLDCFFSLSTQDSKAPLSLSHSISPRLRKTDQNRIARATGAVVVTRTDEIQVRTTLHFIVLHCIEFYCIAMSVTSP